MNLVFLLFSFSGRINRAQFWVGNAIAGVGVSALLIVGLVVTLPTLLTQPLTSPTALVPFVIALFAPLLCGAYVGLALQAKRMHDRGRSAWLTLIPALPGAMLTFNNVFAIVNKQAPAEFLNDAMPWIMTLLLIQLLFIIDLGFFPGKPEVNQHGSPPGGGLNGGGAPPTHTTPIPGRAQPAPQPALGTGASMMSAESAIDRAIAAHERKPQTLQPVPRAAVASSPTPAAPLRPATSGSFGRKAAQ